jgi:hypothetical protein
MEVLRLTEALGFDAFAAAWLHDRPSGLWRYLLVTPMLDTKGPAWVHERLLRAFKKCSLPAGITPLDIFVVEPAIEVAMFGAAGTRQPARARADDPVARETQEIRIDDFSITDGFAAFYRRRSRAERDARNDPATRFDRNVRRLEAA